MKLFSISLVVAALSAVSTPVFADDIGGGFSLSPIADNCQVLLSSYTGAPILQKTAKGYRAVVIGRGADCPKTYSDYPVLRLVTATTRGYLFVGTNDKGRRMNITRKAGSSYLFRQGPKS